MARRRLEDEHQRRHQQQHQQQQQQQQARQHDNDDGGGPVPAPVALAHKSSRPEDGAEKPRNQWSGCQEEGAPRSPVNQWVLMQIVESAESKLMRGGQQPGLSDGPRDRKWSPAGPPDMTNRRLQVNNNNHRDDNNSDQDDDAPAESSPAAPPEARDDGPTPTNDLFRSLVSRDWRALLGSGRAGGPSWRQGPPASPPSGRRQQQRAAAAADRKRQAPEVERRPWPPAAATGDAAAPSEWTSNSEQQRRAATKQEHVAAANDRLHAPAAAAAGPLGDLSAIISKCHTSLQLADSLGPYQLAKRALRSVSPGRRDKSGSLGGCGTVRVPEVESGGAGQARRHSTYLFPSALAGLHGPPGSGGQVSSSSSSSSDGADCNDRAPAGDAAAAQFYASHYYGDDDDYDDGQDDDSDKQEHPYEEDDDADNYHADDRLAAGPRRALGAALGFGRPASSSQLKLRNSASSPSALSTPTNQDWQPSACQNACCRLPEVTAKAGGQVSHLQAPLQLHSQAPGAAKTPAAGQALVSGGGRRGSGVHRKRHSLINVLQAGAGSAGRRLNPRTLFAGAAGAVGPGGDRCCEHRNSLDACTSSSSAASIGSQLYDPLIPESGFKIVVMGTSGSGKTSIIRRYLYNSFSERHNPTVEDTYFVEFPYMKNMINISISDTSGTYQFPAMRKLAINSGDAFILVYSVDSPQSFDELEQLRQSILDERELAYSEGPASGASSLTSNDSLAGSSAGGSQRSSIGSMCAHQLQPLQQRHPLAGGHQPPTGHQQPPSAGGGGGGGGELTRVSDLSASRYWSLGSIFSHHAGPPKHPNSQPPIQQHQQHQHHHPHQPPTHQSFVQCRNSSVSSSSICSSSCSSSADNSRRSSISAAEAALKTRRTRRPPMVIVANKLDLPADKHLVNSDEIEALVVIDWNNGFVRASAALNINIEDIFQQVLRQAKQPPTLTQAIVSKRRKSLPPKFPTAKGR